MLSIISAWQGRVHSVLFLGDGARDADAVEAAFPALAFYRVSGNCDIGGFTPESGLAAFGGVLFFYTHGHNYQVKSGLGGLWQEAKRRGADVALFGHTHVAHCELVEGIYLFNPGSLSLPRNGISTYGIITIENSRPQFEIRENR